MTLRPNPFEDPMPRIVPGEVVDSMQLEPERPRPSPWPRPSPHPRTGSPPVADAPVTRPRPRPTPYLRTPEADPGAAEAAAPGEQTGAAEVEPGGPAGTGRVRPAHTEAERGPRVAILSLREIRPVADYGGLHEAEDALVDTLAAGLYRVVLAAPRYGRPPFDSPVLRRALNTTRLVHPYRIEHHSRGGAGSGLDVLLVLARDMADAAALVGVPGWYELGRTVIVHIAVVTERDLRRYPEVVLQLRRRANALFSGTEMPPLGHLRSERLAVVGVVPPMLDVLAFPTPSDRERTIDVFSPGTPPPQQDLLLRHWANTHNGDYRQDVGPRGAGTSHTQHRQDFTAAATRSRLFLTNFEQFDTRRYTGAHREVGSRFYDAMAAGCALFGDLPVGSRRFAEYVAPARPLVLPSDAQWLPAEVVDALDDHAESDRLGAMSRATALRRGDVAHRWAEMARLAGLPEAPGVHERILRLDQLADQLDPEGVTRTAPSGPGPAESGTAGDGDPPLDGA
jgi:hypothetical protein